MQSVRILQLAARDMPPWMLVELRVSAHRYQEDSSTTGCARCPSAPGAVSWMATSPGSSTVTSPTTAAQ